jgi:RNA recognition motif-containing protein
MNIFVAKLNYRTTSEQLREVFESFGEVKSAKVVTDFETGRSKGFGFVEMAEDSAAHAAINNLDNTELHESTIVVKEARPKRSVTTTNLAADTAAVAAVAVSITTVVITTTVAVVVTTTVTTTIINK